MRRRAVAMIRFYQRQLSPRKGFSCAYRVHTGGTSCSGYGARVIERHGVVLGSALLRRRLQACSEQHRLHAPRHPVPGLLRSQRGELDCDLRHAADCACDAANIADCDECWFELPGEKRRERRNGSADSKAPR
jgi:putative component of membrane protein insertase Oxa1/YidC/SpoIIIJ protein YidD